MEGEKELVLGNKQLVSFFFVVLALCGVFFALGYMIRGNSLKQAVGEQNKSLSDTAADAAPSMQAPAQSQAAQVSEPPRETVEAPQTPPPIAAKPAETAPVHDTAPAHETPPVQAAPLETGVSYLQVAALRRADAENLVKTLREQSFPGLLEQSSKPDLYRVLVGPYRQTADLADAKVKLKALGFADAKVEKR